MINSNFNSTGLPVGGGSSNMTYLYGISDFFTVMFENTDTVNLMLEATSESASDIYSRFLQLTSSQSLADIQTTVGSSIKLVTLSSTTAAAGSVNTYKLPNLVVSSKYIANKPLLPTTLLEDNVDYRILPQTDGTYNIVFYTNLNTLGFPVRTLPDGSIEYALWFVDVQIDEQLISKHFAALIGVTPQASTDMFKNFVYGLYYVYSQGPTLALIRKGLNLALGIPLARAVETVLSIRTYLETDQYIVVTDQNQYLVPYGLYPVVTVGQTLAVSDELAQWVVIKDWIEDGAWWINLAIPPSVIPSLPDNQYDRYASVGSPIEYIMRNYLKSNTFLVNINVSNFKDNQSFQDIASIINNVKPSYTRAIYVWSIPYMEDHFTPDDSSLAQRWDLKIPENVTYPIESFRRDAVIYQDGPNIYLMYRDKPVFMRNSTPPMIQRLMGDAAQDVVNFSVNSSTVTGFINSQSRFRGNTEYETNWINTLLDRYQDTGSISRGKAMFIPRGTSYGNNIKKPYGIVIPSSKRVLPMYVLTEAALQKKCTAMTIPMPSKSTWIFTLFSDQLDDSINSTAVNSTQVSTDSYALMISNYSTLFFRSVADTPTTPLLPDLGKKVWVPSMLTDISPGDYVVGIRILEDLIGLYFVTSNMALKAPYYDPVLTNDQVSIAVTGPMMRGLCPTQSPLYLTRGRGGLSYNNVYTEINAASINDATDGGAGTSNIDNAYSDAYNIASTQVTRNGGLQIKQVLTV